MTVISKPGNQNHLCFSLPHLLLVPIRSCLVLGSESPLQCLDHRQSLGKAAALRDSDLKPAVSRHIAGRQTAMATSKAARSVSVSWERSFLFAEAGAPLPQPLSPSLGVWGWFSSWQGAAAGRGHPCGWKGWHRAPGSTWKMDVAGLSVCLSARMLTLRSRLGDQHKDRGSQFLLSAMVQLCSTAGDLSSNLSSSLLLTSQHGAGVWEQTPRDSLGCE